jgi:predicted phosphate transport protein (TIGR00153 family)
VPRLPLRPQDREFFNLLVEAGANIMRSAELLDRLMKGWPDSKELAREILLCEQEGDRITHDVIHRLNTTSAPPLEREDLFSLAGALDDVVDLIEEGADFMVLYRIEAPMEQALQLTSVLHEACAQMGEALNRLRDRGDLRPCFVEVNRLENEGDRISREALASLFDGGIDPVQIIRWKDIFDRLESAIDACEHATHILEGIVVKGR